MRSEFFDPELHTKAEVLQGGFLNACEDETPEVLVGLHDDVLPMYRCLVERTRSKEVQRLLTGAREALTTGAVRSEEPTSTVLHSLMGVSPMVEGLESFQCAFAQWYGGYHLPDAWVHDQALDRLAFWLVHPETESLPSIPDEDWGVAPFEAEQEKRIAEFKEKAESEDRSKDDRKWYKEEQRNLEKELRDFRLHMKESEREAKQKQSPRHRFPVSRPPVAAEREPRRPLSPPKLVAFDETNELWGNWEQRAFRVIEEYQEAVWKRALQPARREIQLRRHGRPRFDRGELTGGLEPWPETRYRSGDPLIWLIRYQVLGQAPADIAREQRAENKQKWLELEKEKEEQPNFEPGADAVRKSINQLAGGMNLTIRV